ncbi:hypothetical protein [Commensalibacter oyaizuii]|uniref:OmpA-like domain-containing protein n=1 Tax=Commensalibacter oyaizuii TaxID=3043873 RepID=A0ABT6Q0Z9_9PROT|nr:hypothetical protein [Commensalibacter sp. TBRC 16381]MDI2090780.1 hypothetical protein [Commensalibacter sp. TBRC 16381]
MPVIYQPFFRYSILVGLFCLGGCASSPMIKTPVGWYHNLEGGIIAQPRLPAPGHDQSYPYVGLTPTQAPPLPSPALRQEITHTLSQDKTLSAWQDTVDPLEIPKIPPAPRQSPQNTQPSETPKTAQNTSPQTEDQSSSATLDAAGQDPSSDQKNGKASSTSKDAKAFHRAPEPKVPVVMPELRAKIDDQAVVIPAIPVNPPSPPQYPGFNIPADANLPAPFRPSALPLEAPRGELIRFPLGSDAPSEKQDKTINSIAWQRNGRMIFVHGYGDADSINADAQANALSLALLRAKAVAKMLIAHNVPESSIALRAHAIGHGVRIRMDE